MLFLDVETQNFFDSFEAGSGAQFSDLKISFAGAYDNDKDKYYSFWEKDIKKLGELMLSTDRVVGYNVWGFDYGVLQPYLNFEPWELPTLDLMIAMRNTVGFRPKLDTLAKANLGSGKIGTGLDAGEYFRNGDLDKLEEYCLEDVRLTYEVWNIGAKNGKLKYYDSRGFAKETEIDWDQGNMQRAPEVEQAKLL